MVPLTTPRVARHITSVTPMATMHDWPTFRADSEVCDFTAALS